MRRLRLIALLVILFIVLGTASIQLRAYVLEGFAWGTPTVNYYVNPNNLYVPPADAIAAIQSAASNWNNQAGVNLRLAYAGQTSDASLSLDYRNEVFFRNDASGYIAETYWWASNGQFLDGDIVFHENYKIYTGNLGCNGDGYYAENTATHEFGHLLGLAHTTVLTAVMYPSEGACETTKEVLDLDDITGMQAIYSPATNQPPSAPSQLVVATNTSNPTGALSLGWVNTANNANGYRVNRSSDGVNFGQVAQLGSSAVSYTDSGLTSGAKYYYQVYAYNSAGSTASNMAWGQTQSPLPTPPTAPSKPSPANGATGVSTTVKLSWTSSGATTYDVYINGYVYVSGLTTPSVTVSSLTSGSTNSWQVVAKNSVGATAGPTWSFTTQAAATAPVSKGKGRK